MTSDADRIIDLYQRHAHAWDTDRGRDLVEKPWLDKFLALVPRSPSILDIGCGSGEPIGRYLIENGCALTGVDSSSSLIAICRERFPAQRWIIADMRTLSLGQRFDGILAWDSFLHLSGEDQRRMFPLFAQHAAPGTALMLTSGPASGEAIGSYRGERLYHASLDGEEYRRLLDASGFDVISHVIEDQACGGHTVWLARHR